MNNALTIFDSLMGGVQPAQGQTPAGTQSVGTAENTLPFDMLMQQLLGGKSTEGDRQSSFPFVAAPNPALGQKHVKTSDAILTQQHTGQQHPTLSLMTDNQAKGGAVKISTVSPELLMRQLLASGTTARIDLGHNQQIALERSATDGPEVTVSVESLIAQAGFANGDNSALTTPQPQGEAEVPMQQPKISHADASAQQAVTANLSEPELTGQQQAQTINNVPQPDTVNLAARKQASANWTFPADNAKSEAKAAEQPQLPIDPTAPATEDTATESADKTTIDPRVHLNSSHAVRQITLSQPTQLGPGTYEIIDFSIRSDRVQFTLAPLDQDGISRKDAGQQMKISLPREAVTQALESAMNQGPRQITRVQLDGLGQPVRRIEAILNQLNASKIEVAPIESDGGKDSLSRAMTNDSRQIQLTFTPERAQQPPVRVTVNSNQIQAVSEQRINMETAPRVNISDGNAGNSGNGQSFGSHAGNQQDQFAGLFDRHQQMTGSNFKLNTTGDNTTNNRFDQLLGLESQTARNGNMPTADMPEARPVRMVIPEAEMMKLRTTGQTVRLHLEPDTLGPARLTLSMQGDTLKAHVVVDSRQAKAAVESSLQELTQQLSRANIKVDHISVEVGSESPDQQQAFDRRPQWHSRPQGAYANLAGDETNETTENPAILAGQVAAHGYGIGAGGVNLLA